jgi:hypothetical protein
VSPEGRQAVRTPIRTARTMKMESRLRMGPRLRTLYVNYILTLV